MAEVYSNSRLPGRGRDHLNWIISRHIVVQMALYKFATQRAQVARTVVIMHRDSGGTEIGYERHDVDHFVILRDRDPESSDYNESSDRGNTAMSIEFGAKSERKKNGRMARKRGGIHALKAAFPRAID